MAKKTNINTGHVKKDGVRKGRKERTKKKMNSEGEHSFLCEIYYCIVCLKCVSANKTTILIHKTNLYSFETLNCKDMKTVDVYV